MKPVPLNRIGKSTVFLFLLIAASACTCPTAIESETSALPLTPVEAGGFSKTSRYAEVMAFLKSLARESDCMRLETFGESAEGLPLPLAVLGRPLPGYPHAVNRSSTTVLFINANIHAGEVAGKEACLMLIRDLLAQNGAAIPEDLVLLVAPIYNADGNERIDPSNRPWQPGPAEGVGMRTNAQCLDLNRDMMKLESPEARALVKNILQRWDPHAVVDCHTTNGSYHREPITYAPPHTHLVDQELLAFNREKMLPWIARRTREQSGYDSIPYGNFKDPMQPEQGWVTFDHRPRYLSNYIGLRNRLSILVEMYAYAEYEVRIRACRAFLRSIVAFAEEHGETIREITAEADRKVIRSGLETLPPLRFHEEVLTEAFEEPLLILGFRMLPPEEGGQAGEPRPDLNSPCEYRVPYFGRFLPAGEGVPLPAAYIFPRGMVETAGLLRRHGLELEEIAGPAQAQVRTFHIEKILLEERLFQGHRATRIEGSWVEERVNYPGGAYLVRAAQPLFRLAAYLLEPTSDDGLVCWNLLDRYITRGNWDPRPGVYPVARVSQESIEPPR